MSFIGHSRAQTHYINCKWLARSLEFPHSAYALVGFSLNGHLVVFFFAVAPIERSCAALPPGDAVAIEYRADYSDGAFLGLVFNIDLPIGFAAVAFLVYPGIFLGQPFPTAFLANKGLVCLAIQPCAVIEIA